MPEDHNLIRINDEKPHLNEFETMWPKLTTLTPQERADKLWEEGRIRIFTDGAAKYPQDKRLAEGGVGIHIGQNHPCNYADRVHGKGINSYRTELFAVAMVLYRSQNWEEPIWITFDNEAVVKDVQRAINHTLIAGTKSDNQELWEIIFHQLQKEKNRDVKVSWCKGHATIEQVEQGKIEGHERLRNHAADALADHGTKRHRNDSFT